MIAKRIDNQEELEVIQVTEQMLSIFTEAKYYCLGYENKVIFFERFFGSYDNIKEHEKWNYYYIDEKVYKSYYSNNITYFEDILIDESIEQQLTLF